MAISRRGHLKSWLAIAVAAGIGGSVHAAGSSLIGTWSGKLSIGSASLRLRFIVTDDKTAKVISLDQGNAEIPADGIMLEGDTLTLTFTAIKARFEGRLKDADHIEGTFTQMNQPRLLSLHRGEVIEESGAAEPLTLALLQGLRAKAQTPAMGAAWKRTDGPLILVDGLRSSESTQAVTAEDQWHWGSITKSMTATLVARLVEAGVVTWQTSVGSVLGAKVPDMHAAYKDATFLHLLSLRAGLQPNIDVLHLAGYVRDPLPDVKPERLNYATEALAQAPVGPLAAQMVYSNNGYIVVGVMLETVTGQAWEDLIKNYVFEPLQLSSAGFGAPGHPGLIDQPLGHIAAGEKRKPALVGPGLVNDNPVALGPAGRVHMSLRDMVAYLCAHRDQPGAFLKPASWRTLHTPPFGGNYALGWIVRPGGALWHNGSNTVWYGEILVDKKAGVVCAVVANDAGPATQQAVGTALLDARAAALSN
ncbi:hypothetical protein MMA231_00322 [Asticcacaulis sp. MM231]|uniref:serine hydrolase domain-containing protein n=1 Tax=Asticcacaulis sp. MM231 TaxID=3157666 RepID=UPI0032D5AE02